MEHHDLLEHQDYSVFPNNSGGYVIITGDGNGRRQIPAGVTEGVDEILRYDANDEPVTNEEVSLGISLGEMAGEEASAVFYADAGVGAENAVGHGEDYNLEIQVGREKIRSEVAMNTGLSVVSAVPDSSLMYPEEAPEDPKVTLPHSFTHDDMRKISLTEDNSFETDERDIDSFVEAELEGLNQVYVGKKRDVQDRDFAGPVKVGLNVTDSDSEIIIPSATKRSTRWILDNLDRDPFFLENYQHRGEVKGPTHLTETLESQKGLSLTPAVRTKEDISNGNGTISYNSPEGPEVAADFYLVDSEGEMFPAPNYVVVDKMIGEGEFLIERTDEILEHNEGNGRPDSSPGFQ